ncbi:MAG: proton-conducting transporter transmembrane domain-containing protein [Roseinatronobacter sp.]
MIVSYLPLVSILLLVLTGLRGLTGPQFRPHQTLHLAEAVTLACMGLAGLTALQLALHGAATVALGPFSLRIDLLSVLMLALVSFLGWVILRYSRRYLDGEAQQGAFTGWLLIALASVTLLVSAGNLVQMVLGFILAGHALQKLVLFYADRPQAQRAARKMRVASVSGDVALILATLVLITGFGTDDIFMLNAIAHGPAAQLGAGLLVLGGVLKAAQFPLHGWLTEVIEAPTPVSALLHAGIVNAGGFVLIRMADVLLTAPGIMAALALLGGFTALLGGLAMLAQPAVKTSLAWSTIAQMGFMMLQIGLGLFALAVLHILAHSLYKAHAFLSSGAAVLQVQGVWRPGPVAVPSGRNVGRAFLIALAIFALVGLAFGLAGKPPQTFALGAILIFGIAYLIAQGLADAAPAELTRRTTIAAGLASAAYFTLHAGIDWMMAGTLPATPAPTGLEWAVMMLVVISFGLVALAQALFPLWASHPAAQGLRVHLANGLYIAILIDRLTGRLPKTDMRADR